jgi:hypothetical protein
MSTKIGNKTSSRRRTMKLRYRICFCRIQARSELFFYRPWQTFSLARLVRLSHGLTDIPCLNRGTAFSAIVSMLLMRHERQSKVVTSRPPPRRTAKCMDLESRSLLAHADEEAFTMSAGRKEMTKVFLQLARKRT